MNTQNRNRSLLDLMLRPAFCAEGGCICHINSPAAKYLLQVGLPVQELILNGREEYADFQGGCLYVTLQLGDALLGASVVRMDGQDIFILEEPQTDSQLQAMALAAKQLREPMAGIMTVADRLLPNVAASGDAAQEQVCQMNRRLFQMMRMLINMSDAYHYTQAGTGRMEYIQAAELFREVFDRAGQLLQAAGRRLEYTGPEEPVYTLADPERLERAAYNLLSNAAKYAPAGGVLTVRLSKKGNRLALSVTDNGPGIDSAARGSLFGRFQREPGLEDLRNGIGLGLVLVRSIAAQHGGAVLVDQPEAGGTRTTMTIQLRQSREATLRSPGFRIDYAGEWDHGLLELSDCLPSELYENI